MLRKSQIVWSYILEASVRDLLVCYGMTCGYFQLDDSDIQRSKQTPRIAQTPKVKDKTTNGLVNAQNILFPVLVPKDIPIPVGFRFYCPDPALTAWYKEDKRLRAKKVKKKYRPVKTPENPRYPNKKALAHVLIKQFNRSF
ncbi:MAG: transposase, partial [Planctomycetes bacterium]|nr:transposase [Planctomycetota bacterium]